MGAPFPSSASRSNFERSDNFFCRTRVRGTNTRFGLAYRGIASPDLSVFSNQSRLDQQGVSADLYVALESVLGRAFVRSASAPQQAIEGLLQELSFHF